jgi:hypothetical protein
MSQKALNLSHAKLFTGMDEVDFSMSEAAYIHPASAHAVVGAGFARFQSKGLHTEDTIVVSYAHRYGEGSGGTAVGVSLRHLTQSFELDERSARDPVFQKGRRQSAMALDLHAHTRALETWMPGLALGLSVRSLNRPDIGFLEEERLPLETVAGVVYRWRTLALPLDVVKRDGSVRMRLGMEAAFAKERFAIRAGGDPDRLASGIGYRQALPNGSSLLFDYAFIWPLKLKESSGSHRVTMGVKF